MTLNLETLTLAHGAHDRREQGVCLMEAVAWWAGKEHTDHPPCVSPVASALDLFTAMLHPAVPNGV
jgi:hypothetical protein